MNVMSKKIARYLSVILAVSVLFSGISLQIPTAYADTADSTASENAQSVVSADSGIIDYVEYTAEHGITDKATADI